MGGTARDGLGRSGSQTDLANNRGDDYQSCSKIDVSSFCGLLLISDAPPHPRGQCTGLRGLRRMSRWVPMPPPQEEYTVNHLVRFPSNRDAVELAASVFLPGNDLGRQSADNVGRDAASSSSSDSSPPSSSRQGVVMVHAHPKFGGAPDMMLGIAADMASHGFCVVNLALRGSGESAGGTSWKGDCGEVADVVTACDYCKEVLQCELVHLMGYSFGATVCGGAIDKRDFIATYVAIAYPLGHWFSRGLFGIGTRRAFPKSRTTVYRPVRDYTLQSLKGSLLHTSQTHCYPLFMEHRLKVTPLRNYPIPRLFTHTSHWKTDPFLSTQKGAKLLMHAHTPTLKDSTKPKLFLIGTIDDFTSIGATERFATRCQQPVVVKPHHGCDHFGFVAHPHCEKLCVDARTFWKDTRTYVRASSADSAVSREKMKANTITGGEHPGEWFSVRQEQETTTPLKVNTSENTSENAWTSWFEDAASPGTKT